MFDRFFRSSDEGLLFVGFAAEHRFGPLARFIPGARFTANRVRQALLDRRAHARMPSQRDEPRTGARPSR